MTAAADYGSDGYDTQPYASSSSDYYDYLSSSSSSSSYGGGGGGDTVSSLSSSLSLGLARAGLTGVRTRADAWLCAALCKLANSMPASIC